ncbi:phage infection protein [Lentilactobacillus parakefiri]|uniref:YhgE/Pip domain-containing protein n=1 Tax=Lentilactobacillus parakefiri TaxID=152332 RepID=UPI000BA60FFE|nr:YhgE/Pip domain-containing protein [Lentilactobacillus parakefiri]PAK99537.1 phage infection protein [Lentilactobacillus parakefiri]
MFKNIKLIYQRDIKAIFKYKAALLTITALCVLPCLYTLVNVKAIWNPYTSQEVSKIPVAVVNNDQGTTVQGKQMNLGNQIIAQLKHNNQIGWRFVDSKTAQKKVRAGKYYAEIRIPQNFSADLGSMVTDNPKKAHIDYIADTKASPMSYKITEAASKTLLNTIKKQFIYQVNSTIFSYLNVAGKKAGDNQSEILNLKDLIINLGDSMELATNTLGDISEATSGLAMVFSELKPVVAASSDVNINQAVGMSNQRLIKSVNHSVNQSFSNVQTSLNSIQSDATRLRTLTSQLNKLTTPATRNQASGLAGQILSQIKLLQGQITPLISYLQTINQSRRLTGVTSLIQQLNDVNNLLASQLRQISELSNNLNSGRAANSSLQNKIASQSYSVAASLNRSLSDYNRDVKSELNGIQRNLLSASNRASRILNNVNDIRSLNEKSLDTIISGNQLVSSSTGNLENQLLQYRGLILQASNQLKLTSDNNIADIISILQNNPKLMGNALAQPFNVKNENIYRVPSFGEAFAPTYMALSIWVGCAMLVAVLHTSAPKYHRFKNLRPREEYIGKLLLFNTLSMIQTMVIVLSTVFILRVHVESLFLMVMIGVVSSLTFSVIVYTMASVFGNLGKALAVMMVAFQLAGSGAIYPIQLNPLFMRIIQPIFPFSYSVSGFREAVGGPNVGTVVLDFFVLICMLIGGLIIGLFMKDFFKRVTARLLNDFTKSGIGQP